MISIYCSIEARDILLNYLLTFRKMYFHLHVSWNANVVSTVSTLIAIFWLNFGHIYIACIFSRIAERTFGDSASGVTTAPADPALQGVQQGSEVLCANPPPEKREKIVFA